MIRPKAAKHRMRRRSIAVLFSRFWLRHHQCGTLLLFHSLEAAVTDVPVTLDTIPGKFKLPQTSAI